MGNEDKLLSYNGRINNHRKFKEIIFPGNEFSLKISNVTAADVNISYRCRYGFDAASLFIELNEYNYVSRYQIWYKIHILYFFVILICINLISCIWLRKGIKINEHINVYNWYKYEVHWIFSYINFD